MPENGERPSARSLTLAARPQMYFSQIAIDPLMNVT
jgi:hypothetical protein